MPNGIQTPTAMIVEEIKSIDLVVALWLLKLETYLQNQYKDVTKSFVIVPTCRA